MSSEQFGLPNDPYNSEKAVRSIQNMYIKEENAENRTNDVIILNDGEAMSDSMQEYNFAGDEIISTSEMDSAQNLITTFNRIPVELTEPCKSEYIKMERSHFVKYVLKDGKHIKVWECGICAKEFGHQYTLMRHLPTHTDERKFQCNTCGKAFRQMSTLSQHRAIHSAARPYVCEICRKTFNRVSTLISHRKTHTGLKPHRCHLCNKAFHQKGNLRNHIFTHTNERPYKCDVCGKGFNQMSNLMCHKLKAHQRADKPRYTCQVCGKNYPKRRSLRHHEQCQHGLAGDDASSGFPEPPALEHCPSRESNNTAAGRSKYNMYNNGVLVEPINTEAMKLAIRTNQTPFALLRPLNGIPVLVRVLPAGDKQMLVPATAEDLRRHGQITIMATPTEQASAGDTSDSGAGGNASNANATATTSSLSSSATSAGPSNSSSSNNKGSTVQIKIPVVATVVQRCSTDGQLCMAVQSPGPKESTSDAYVIAEGDGIGQDALMQDPSNNALAYDQNQVAQQIQYLDEAGNIISEEEYNAKSQIVHFDPNDYSLLPSDAFSIGQTIDLSSSMGPMPPNDDLLMQQNVEEIHFDSDDIHLTSLETRGGAIYEVENSAFDVIDKMIEQKPDENEELGNEIMLNENNQDESITMFSEAANILYDADTQYIL